MFYGWIILTALSAVYFLGIGVLFYGIIVVIPDMITSMAWSRSEVSLGYTVLLLAFGVLSPFAAFTLRHIGARRMMGIGAGIAALGALGCYYMNSLTHYYLSACVMALGSTMLGGVACGHTLAAWFARKRALALGIFLSMGGLAAFASAPAVSLLVQGSGDWRNAFLLILAAALMAGLIAIIFVRNSPADMGTFVDGVDPVRAAANPSAAAPSRVFQTDMHWEVKDAVRTLAFWITVLASTTAVFGIVMVNSQAVLHLRDMGISPLTAAAAIGVIGLFGAGGRLLSGVLGDRIEPRFIYSFGLVLEAIAVILLTYTDTVFMTYAVAVMVGAGNGLAIVANPAMVANYFGSQKFAALMSIHGLIVTIIGSLSPYVASRVFEISGSYEPAFLAFAVISLIPVACLLRLRSPERKPAPVLSLQTAE
jgi:MFS family permease